LGANKFSVMRPPPLRRCEPSSCPALARRYLAELKAKGLSRDPVLRKNRGKSRLTC
jgi:hypothetical protein